MWEAEIQVRSLASKRKTTNNYIPHDIIQVYHLFFQLHHLQNTQSTPHLLTYSSLVPWMITSIHHQSLLISWFLLSNSHIEFFIDTHIPFLLTLALHSSCHSSNWTSLLVAIGTISLLTASLPSRLIFSHFRRVSTPRVSPFEGVPSPSPRASSFTHHQLHHLLISLCILITLLHGVTAFLLSPHRSRCSSPLLV